MKKIFPLVLILFFFAVLQTSFFIFLKVQPNLILVSLLSLFIFNNIQENSRLKNNGLELISVILAGFFLDVSSSLFLGTGILTFLLIFYLIKMVLKNIRGITLALFSMLILLGTALFEISLPVISLILSKVFNTPDYIHFNFGYSLLLKMIYNVVLGMVGFYIVKLYQSKFA